MTIDEIYFSEVIKEAEAGAVKHEEPIGAVVALGSRVVGRAHHQTKSLKDPTAYAAMIALTQAAGASENRKLKRASLYTTEMPCRMCLAAAQLAGVKRIVYGVQGKSLRRIHIPMKSGILERECRALRLQKL